jgi:preprotein translocase subunit SecD
MKNRRKYVVSLVLILVLSLGSLAGVLVAGYSPALGLDLQGGASVVLAPTGETTEENLEQAISIIRSRVDGLGVAEPDIARQGEAIVVQLPGVDDPRQALEVVGRTAELRFRPVLGILPPGGEVPLPAGGDEAGPDAVPDPGAETPPTTEAGVEEAPAEEGEAPPAQDAPTEEAPEETGMGAPAGGTAAATPVAEIALAASEAPADDADEAPADEAPEEGAPDPLGEDAEPIPAPVGQAGGLEVTSPEDDVADQQVVLPGKRIDGEEPPLYVLGPARLFGDAVEDAQARLQGTVGTNWVVNITMTEEGIEDFNALAAECFATSEACPPVGSDAGQPRGAVAIVLDGVVESWPTINQPSFQRDQIQISGSFTDQEARDLALVLRFGALPVELEAQTVQTVSATLGSDSLRAGLIAGIIGLGLVAVYMVAYYRALGVLAIVSLVVSGSLLYAIISFLGETTGLALTLAGITGIIVSIGVAVDSNVVYYERVKESVMQGSTMRSATDRGFKRAFSTILRADAASLIGAGLLYYFTVGPVRGFAFYLGLATIIDVVTSYFFMRPAAILLGRTKWGRPAMIGVPKTRGAAAAVAGGGR